MTGGAKTDDGPALTELPPTVRIDLASAFAMEPMREVEAYEVEGTPRLLLVL